MSINEAIIFRAIASGLPKSKSRAWPRTVMTGVRDFISIPFTLSMWGEKSMPNTRPDLLKPVKSMFICAFASTATPAIDGASCFALSSSVFSAATTPAVMDASALNSI